MNKAFIKEDDLVEEVRGDELAGTGPRLVTPDGCSRFQEELRRLKGSTSDDRDTKQRIGYLERLLARLTVVPQRHDDPRAWFGAWVTIEDDEGARRVIRLVGPDEVDRSGRLVSIDSPIAKALLGKRVGDAGVLTRPRLRCATEAGFYLAGLPPGL